MYRISTSTEIQRITISLFLLFFGFAILPFEPVRAAEPPTKKAEASFAMGADLSMLQWLEDHGVHYKEGGQVKDGLAIFKDHGCNFVRLRLFVNPNGTHGQVNDLAYAVALAKRVTQAGMRWLLDFHYSDGWADPGMQLMPAAWKNLTHAELAKRVFDYTKATLTQFRKEDCLPDMVQVGNEITNGMLWDDGGPLNETKWDTFTDLLKAGIRGVREAPGGDAVKVMVHIDRGANNKVSRWFFEHLQKRKVDFDVIGLSYYPMESKDTLDDLRANLAFLEATYGKDIILVETAYCWRSNKTPNLAYPYTPAGQRAYLEELIRVVAGTPGGRGKGVFYWAPEWIDTGGKLRLENRTLFNDSGEALPGISAFGIFSKSKTPAP